MRISKIELQNFKRFTNLVVKEIPESAKLVVIVGSNGSGKSSLFDAFVQWYRNEVGFGYSADDTYFRKDLALPATAIISLHNKIKAIKGSCYVRSAYRNDPDFSISNLRRLSNPSQVEILGRTIDVDKTVSENYQRLIYDTVSGVYDEKNNSKTVELLREELIGELSASMKKVFGDISLNNISDPLGGGTFYFDKGVAKNYNYKNLSGGEKAAFDLLLDFHIKKKYFKDAIYCVDEVETHLHTKVQGKVVKELVAILPEDCQLWLSTHSLGVLRAAQELNVTKPGSVCVIDFDVNDPDVFCELLPCSLGRVAWEKVLSLTLDDLSTRITPKHIVYCEGSSVGNRRKDFDAEIYNRVLGKHFSDILFMSGGSATEIINSKECLHSMIDKVSPDTQIWALRDRDSLSSEQIEELRKQKILVLKKRNLESYIFDDEVVSKLVESQKKSDLIPNALKIKEDALANSVKRGNASDDYKSAAGEIYNGLKNLLSLTQCGSTSDAFMRDTLAPLIEPTMNIFDDLKKEIIENLNQF